MGTPSEQNTAFRQRQEFPVFAEFAELYDFPLDDFQVRACHELEQGRGVLVAAPTGSGKTIVGEFAIHLALSQGRKAFYTAPIKALSNQKFHDLVQRYGPEQVGLLTGDNSVNGDAPIVVMTTEVLRNMLYAGSRTLTGLGYVVMDEVHYLADRMRGAVWEEVIIHLPESVALVSLSATVSNAEEFGDWLETVRGEITTIVEERRPVPLFQHVIVGKQMHDLFADSDADAKAGFVREGAPVNPQLLRVARDDWASGRTSDRRSPRDKRKPGQKNVGNGRRVWTPSRVDVIERLQRDNLLPAIVFIFSRVGCDAAVTQCLESNLRLTTADERDEIFAYVESKVRHLPPDDLQVLGYDGFLDGLTRGVASHHAGMLPTFKECVEELFQRGLCKAVFATETLALGINMPARTVVIEKLTKWNGETHADITPGEYTQLTGRAGRRGLDVEGHGVVLWQQGTNPKELAGLASKRTYPLRSSFRPSYNMAVNLVQQFGRATARELLESSFAQFQADRAVVGLARQHKKAEDALDGYVEAATCHLGDFMEYAALRRRISDAEKAGARDRRNDRRSEAAASLEKLRPGDIIMVPNGKYSGFAVVIEPGITPEGPRPYVVTADRQARRLAMMDFGTPVKALGSVRIPRGFSGRNPQMRRDVVNALREKTHGLTPPPPTGRGPSVAAREQEARAELTEADRLRRQLREHPCHNCPDREDHARWAERWFKLQRDSATLQRRIESRTNTIARQFDRVCDVLISLDYLSLDDEDTTTVTDQGRQLMRIHTDMDLLAAESLRAGLWDDLTPPELAAVLSVLVFEGRRADDQAVPRLPGDKVKQVVAEMVHLWAQLDVLEKENGLEFLREPDMGFAWAAYRWAEGDDLDDVLRQTGQAAGDFVRWIKQLLDLTDQIASAAAGTPLRNVARAASDQMRRGVVAFSTLGED
ncbi:DEAD/DEAH box helicase [Nocardioides cavernaquae]|uniref:DEAD/DEAH box helicase n=1 Tax=Nocardioides cavernaquae TaxID=2321396 RepID=A0A3A5HCL5_9ACTN|nr:DEAD/DEAH box helicase [Nocardioides cavernaquae]RJS47215.1 DEAD/DEAH box helicase [Nocardioides cavernaquae]RJS48019.1 DEAD/DEAH box helicase [Nocardioides cavernaquae]